MSKKEIKKSTKYRPRRKKFRRKKEPEISCPYCFKKFDFPVEYGEPVFVLSAG